MTKMSDQAAESNNIWFLRVEGAQLGPYPSARVRNLLANGELSLHAEISRDRKSWKKIQSVPEVVPLKLRAQLGDRSAQTLVHARRVAEQQSRTVKSEKFPVAALLVVSLLISGILAVSIWRGLPQERDVPDCSAQAAPQVNWSNCVLIGIDVGAASLAGANLNSANLRQAKLTATNLMAANLRYSDLSGADMSYAQLKQAVLLGANLQGADLAEADLTEADLRFADLTGSRLEGARLNGARLSEAIWIDGKPCAGGSVGKCLR
ncbi:MAG: pentapeptide repeat-containing protein [Pseudomonadota bacterium]